MLSDVRLSQSIFPIFCKVEQFILSAADIAEEGFNINVNKLKESLTSEVRFQRLENEL